MWAAPVELHYNANLFFGPDTLLEIELAGPTIGPPTEYDRLIVDGLVSLDGTLTLAFIDGFAQSIANDDVFSVITTTDGILGQWDNVASGQRLGVTGGGGTFLVEYGAGSPQPNNLVLSDFLLPPQTAIWLGGTDSWVNAAKWNINKVPRNQGIENYEVFIGSNVTVTLNEDVTVNSLTLGTSASPTLTGTGDLTVATLSWQRGVLAGATGEGDLIVTEGGTIGTNASLNLSRRIVNQGTLTWAGVNIFGDGTGIVENTAGATLILTPGGNTTGGSSGPSIINDGTLRMTGTSASGTFTHNRALTSAGAIEVLGGTLDLRGPGTVLSGPVSVATGAVLKLSSASSPFVSITSDITGDGTVVLENGTTSFDNPGGSSVNNLVMNAQGHIAGSGHLTATNLTWVSSGSMIGSGTTTVTGTATFVNPSNPLSRQLFIEGTLDWQNGLLFGNGTLQIESGAQANLLVQGGSSGTATTTVVINDGTMVVDNPDPGIQPNFEFFDLLTNDGLVQIVKGAFIIRGTNSANNGDIQIDGGRLELRALNFTSTGSITGAGEVLVGGNTPTITGAYDVATTNVSGGTPTFSSAATPAVTDTLTLTGGTIAGNPGITADSFTWTTGGAISGRVTVTGTGSLNIATSHNLSGQLVNQGTLDWLQGSIASGGTGTLRNEIGAVLNIRGASDRSSLSPNGVSFVNEGTISKMDAAVVTINKAFDNTSGVVVEGGTLSLGSVTQHVGASLTDGTWEVRDAATLTFSSGSNITTNQGAVVLRGPTSIFARINTLANNQGRFEIRDGRNFTTVGNLANSGQIVIGATSTLTVSGNYNQTGASSSIAVDGTLNVAAGTPTLTDGAVLSGAGVLTGPLVVASGGIVSPGASPGTLTVADFTLGEGGIYHWELDEQGLHDRIDVTGTLTLGADVTLQLADLGGMPEAATDYVLFSYPATAADPPNVAWTLDNALAPMWNVSAASVLVDADNDRVVLRGLSFQSLQPGDIDQDGDVDRLDAAIFAPHLGKITGSLWATGDFDGDAATSLNDLALLQSNLGQSTGPSPTINTVPEPSTAVLFLGGLAVGIAAYARRTRHRINAVELPGRWN